MRANNTRIAVLGEVILPFKVGEYNGVVTGLVSEHVSEIILGIEWLVENGVTWVFGQSRIRMGEVYYPLHCRSDAGVWCRRIVLQNNVTIPARSEANVSTKEILRNLSDSCCNGNSSWSTEPRSVTSGVHVSRTVIPSDRLVDIPVRVMNARKESVIMKAGASIADVHPVTVVGCVHCSAWG